jgi:GTP cyclohydrolase I
LKEEADMTLKAQVHRLHPARRANQALDLPLTDEERESMIAAASRKFEELLEILKVDHCGDHNTRDTPRRVARMFVEETMAGRFCEPPSITAFENTEQFQNLIVTGPITIRSTCAHHFMPIYGHAYIGILPAADGRIIGLSKYDRIVQYFASRPQIQEELVQQIGRHIVDATSPRGLAVRISAVHMCKTHRGIHATHQSRMITSSYFGEFNNDGALKEEFLQECATLERSI